MFQSKSSEQAGGVALSNRWSALEEQPDSDSKYSAAVINRDVDDMETTVHYVRINNSGSSEPIKERLVIISYNLHCVSKKTSPTFLAITR